MSDVNMLTSLKALLFSSAATPASADGAGVSAMPAEGAADFAKLLNGTMEAAPDAQPVVDVPGLPPVAGPAAVAEGEDIAPVEPTLSLPHGLTTALQAVQSHRKDSLPLPPGLARRLEALADAADAAPSPVVDGQPVEDVTVPPIPEAGEEAELDTPELPVAKPHAQTKATKEAQSAKVEALPDLSKAEEPDQAVTADQSDADQGDADKPKERTEAASLPPPVFAAVQTPVQPSPPAQALPAAIVPAAAPAPEREKAPVKPDSSARPVTEAQQPPQAATPELAAVVEKRTAPQEQAQPANPGPSVASAPAERPKINAAATSESIPIVAEPAIPVAPASENRPVKSEALALLQMVRDQVAVRQPGTPVRAGEPLATRSRTGRAAAPVEAAPVNATQPMPTDAAPQPVLAQSSVAPTIQPTITTPPVVDLSASLGAQVVDMGVSGQWIDGLARDIAGLSANGAQGRFQINTDQLGPVQVDIRQGHDGAAVSLTVPTEAAETALRQDSDRLRLDAGLSAVRIAEVKIERAPHVAEAARADSANQQNGQQNSSQTANGWANNGQNMAQSQQQSQQQAQSQARWRTQENSAFAAKNSGDPAVLNHDDTGRAGNDSLRARYA